MKVFFDHQVFSEQKYGGISRYFVECISHLKIDTEITSLFSDNVYLKENGFCNHFPIPFVKGSNRIKIIRKINDIYTLFRIKTGKFDIFHPTYYNTYFLDYLPSHIPVVLTCYDLIHEKFANKYNLNQTLAYKRERLLKRANVIVAISENTKNDLIEYYRIQPDKIKVIYLATNFDEIEVMPVNNISLPEKYILFVGNRGEYKNFIPFVEAIADILIGNKDIKLICAGGKNFNKKEDDLLKKLNIAESIFFVDFKSDKELKFLYKNAIVFVFPSLYEGFGIPVLEAFASDCPVIASGTSSLPEVGGQAVLYINPEDKNSIRQSIEKVIYNPDFRAQLIKKGKIQLSEFSWAKTASQHQKLYASLL